MESKDLAPLDLIQILDRVYPVGTPYFNKLDNRNPNLILGFGTWVAETGFLAGKSASGTFATLGSTGGAETVTLTTAQMPSHTHTTLHRSLVWDASLTSICGPAAGWQIQSSGWGGNILNNTGGGGSHPNLPPYTVYAWWVRVA